MSTNPECADEYKIGLAPTIDTTMKEAEAFWHRARRLINLPPNKFIGVNHIATYLLGMKSYDELTEATFDTFELLKDGTWRTRDH